MAQMTPEEMAERDLVEQKAIAAIEGQNWTDNKLTADEKHLIGLAVDFVMGEFRRGNLGKK